MDQRHRDAPLADGAHHRGEADALLLEEGAVGLVGGGEVGVEAAEAQPRQPGDARDRFDRRLGRDAEAVHPRVDLDVDGGLAPARRDRSARDHHRAVAVRIGLDHRHDPGAPTAAPPEEPHVVRDRVEIDLRAAGAARNVKREA